MIYYKLGSGGSFMSAGSAILTHDADAIVWGLEPLPQPAVFDHVEGERLPDLFGIARAVAVSPRLAGLLTDLEATGYSLQPVTIQHPVVGARIEGYGLLTVHGRGGALDEARMQPMQKSETAIMNCNGFYIYEDQWDGSDVFCIEGLGTSVWVTERIAKALMKVKPKLRNVYLTINTDPWPTGPIA